MAEHQLIPVTLKKLAGESVQTVDARDLHEFLKVETRFDKWIDKRIQKFGFVENIDFFSDGQKRPSLGAIKPATEYALTLDMARELAMVERNEQGRQARRYFIACEKALREEASVCGGVPALLAGQLERLLADTGGLNRAQAGKKMFDESNDIRLYGSQVLKQHFTVSGSRRTGASQIYFTNRQGASFACPGGFLPYNTAQAEKQKGSTY